MILLEVRFKLETCNTIKYAIAINLSLETLRMLHLETNINAHFFVLYA